MDDSHEKNDHVVSLGHTERPTEDATSGTNDHQEEQSPETSDPTEDHSAVAPREDQQNRLSAYSFSNLPEAVPPDTYHGLQVQPTESYRGLHPVPADVYLGKQVINQGHKEVVPNRVVLVEHLPEHFDGERPKEASLDVTEPEIWPWPSRQEPPPPKTWKQRLNHRRICGIRAKWALLGLGSLLLLIIILGAGLGAGLKRSGHSASRDNSPSYALNGTKISLVTQTFTDDDEESLVMYFQHSTGQIRYMKLGSDGEWTGGDSKSIVASNAKNNTPISAVSYVWSGVSFWRVFYIDNTNIIREIWAGNNTQGWALGPLSDMSISAMDDDHVGMVACWYGPTDPDKYAEGYASTSDSSLLAIRLVYAQNATTFRQLNYHGSNQEWIEDQTLTNLNGHASPACYSRGQGTVDYMMFLDLQNKINLYWRDTDTTLTNTTTHPINMWTNASIAISNVQDNATLGYTKYLYAQDRDDKLIRAYNISFDAENTRLDTGGGFVVQGNPGIINTGLGITARPDHAGGDDVIALYQTDGSHIGYYERDSDGVSWISANIGVPP